MRVGGLKSRQPFFLKTEAKGDGGATSKRSEVRPRGMEEDKVCYLRSDRGFQDPSALIFRPSWRGAQPEQCRTLTIRLDSKEIRRSF